MSNELVGLIPAAGYATRISPLPASKELFPIGFRKVQLESGIQLHPKVISHYLLDNMFQSGTRKVYIVLRRDKTDIMDYYGDGKKFGGHIAYLADDNVRGMPYTMDVAWPWLQGNTVLFGMPDTIFTPADAFSRLLAQHHATNADVTLGIFPTNCPEKLCPVELDESARVLTMIDKPAHAHIRNTWGCGCWDHKFTEFMHNYLEPASVSDRTAVLADVFLAALEQGLSIFGLFFAEGEYIDIGTPDDLAMAVKRFNHII